MPLYTLAIETARDDSAAGQHQQWTKRIQVLDDAEADREAEAEADRLTADGYPWICIQVIPPSGGKPFDRTISRPQKGTYRGGGTK